MKVLYLAVVVMLLVVATMADPACKNRRTCYSKGGSCTHNCDKAHIIGYACDCNIHGLICCRPHKKG